MQSIAPMNTNALQFDFDVADSVATAAELRVVIGQLSRRLRKEAHLGDFTWSQVSVLALLERDGPATVTTLARAEGVRPQSMGATVSTLEAAGLILGAADPNDGRQTVFSITDSCRDAIRAGRAAREDWLCRVLRAKLDPAEQEKLATCVDLLKRLLD